MTMPDRPFVLSRRMLLRIGGSVIAAAAAGRVTAQAAITVKPFSFDRLIERARNAAQAEYQPPEALGAPFSDLDYDDYRNIQFRPENAVWQAEEAEFVLHAYHPGWLFDGTVPLFEVEDGRARPIKFTAADFNYYGSARDTIPEGAALPGVAGFRLNAPLNSADRFDEVVSFLGASYFRALGQGNRYGLSARGLAVNTAVSGEEEFPRFSAFWLERPDPASGEVTFYAMLESQSVTGAYRFVLRPGETTTMDVELHLFFRQDVRQLGIAPLTSMFLFGPNDGGPFDDYRTRVHDSEALVLNLGESTLVRVLANPPRLANSYFGAQSPGPFGLVQRHRDFDDYLDAGAHYEARPSLMVEPLNDWGAGTVRLIEIPSDLEANDNIVAFWIPEGNFAAGDTYQTSYRLHWGMTPPGARSERARILRTLGGFGGVAGVEPRRDRRKFVIDFQGGMLGEPQGESEVEARVSVANGTLEEQVLQYVEGPDGLWRLVLEVRAEAGAVTELKADLVAGDRTLSETWVYQWMRD